MKTLRLLAEYHTRLLRGHPWAWRGDFTPDALDGVAPGEAVRLESSHGDFLGVGLANPRSHVAVRLVSREDRPPDAGWIRHRLDGALAWRERVRSDTSVCRLVYGESDGLPGLAVDRYGPVLVLSQTVAGMEPWTDLIAEELDRRLHPETIILKNTNLLRRLEGLPLETRVLKGAWTGPVEVDVDGSRVVVDCLGGRKTGLFLDHRENRRLLARLVRGGETVLDLYSHCGLWSLACLAAGAERAVAVDSDAAVLALGRASASANDWSGRLAFVESDAAVFLEAASGSPQDNFDIVVLDPPAFAKKKRYLKDALETYARLHALALRRVAPGGLLVASSCSSFVTREMLTRLAMDAATAAGRVLQLVAEGTQALDHPVLLPLPETRYLKCLFYRAMDA
jgi:23S rRNA (cytosine1962-C5)-methyltransferase